VEKAGDPEIAVNEPTGVPPATPAPGHLTWIQARLALERTLLAWVRTGAAFIGFGFAIFHFLDALNKSPDVVPPRVPDSPRILGISLVAIGTLAMILALIQYFSLMRYLEGATFRGVADLAGVPRLRPGLVVAVVLTAVGLITLWVLLVRVPR
jgi:putative membrane protein